MATWWPPGTSAWLDDVSRWLTRAPATLEEYRASFEDASSLAKTLVVELEGQVIGDLMLQVEDGWAQAEVAEQALGVHAELGWVPHPDHAGHGYATEAVRELLRLCFAELGLRRVTAKGFADNVASWRLMERVGMRRELYALREPLHRCGDWLDVVGYALLRRGVDSNHKGRADPELKSRVGQRTRITRSTAPAPSTAQAPATAYSTP